MVRPVKYRLLGPTLLPLLFCQVLALFNPFAGVASLLTKQQQIPRILHQVFLEGEQALKQESRRNDTAFRQEWLDSCRRATKGWTHMFWDLSRVQTLLQSKYPWFLPAFAAYPKTVLKGDAIRPFILHAYGGLYLDMDVECYRSPEPSLSGFDLVFQSEFREGRDINNAVMAGVPGHPFWMQMMIMLFMRYDQTLRTNISWSLILDSTGPGISKAAFRTFFPGIAREDNFLGSWRATSSTVRVFGLGTWFCPCQWDNELCHGRVDEMRVNGTLPSNLVGHHRYSGSWTPTKHGMYREEAVLLGDRAPRAALLPYLLGFALLALLAVAVGYAALMRRWWQARMALPTTLPCWPRASISGRARGD